MCVCTLTKTLLSQNKPCQLFNYKGFTFLKFPHCHTVRFTFTMRCGTSAVSFSTNVQLSNVFFFSFQKACTNAAMASGGSSPQVQPCHIFGVCKGVRNNLLFQDEETMIFPSGNHCVRYHVLQRRTKFIHGKPAESITSCRTFFKMT